MKIVCDNCSTKYSIADEKVRGKVFKIKCKKCSHIIVVKGQEDAAPGAAPGAAAPPGGFDQKETRVFDYSGFEGGGEAVWHLVIDREQVGPLGPADLAQKWQAGEIDGETYGWREGMGDWLRLAAIPELAFLMTGGAPPPAAGGDATTTAPAPRDDGGLFGNPDASSAATGRADPADLFAAAAASSSEDEGDLFGARAPAQAGGDFAAAPAASGGRRSVPKDDLFAGGDAGGGGMAAAEAGGGKGMTGQRNENSVLFSLSNLAALASESPASSGKSSSSSASSSPSPSFQSSAGSEGSGLIDIRAMAAVTLGNKGDAGGARPAAPIDDLPVFSGGGGFGTAPAGAVLLPSVGRGGGDNKKLIIIIGSVIGVLLIAVVGLLFFVLKGDKGGTVAAGPVAGDKGPADPAGGVVPPGGDKPADPGTPPGGGDKPADPGTPPGGDKPGDPGGTPPGGDKPPVDPGADKPEDKKPPGDRRPAGGDRKPDPPRDPKPPREVEPKPPKEPPASKCDEVSCAIDPSLPCCKKGGSTPKPTGGGGADLPESLVQGDIKAGMATVKGRVAQCADQFKATGMVIVKIQINGDGAVTSAATQDKFAGTPTGACVERAVKAAKFKKSKSPSLTVKYPFQF